MASKPQPPSSEKLSRMVRWVVIAFFAYAIAHAFIKPGSEPETAVTNGAPGDKTTKSKDCNTATGPIFPSFALLPSITPQLRADDTTQGTGEPAVCGQTASISYEYATRKGQVIFSTQNLKKPVEDVHIGKGDLLPGLEQGIIGMKQGGERILTIPPALAFYYLPDVKTLRHGDAFHLPADQEIKNQTITAKVKLMALSPALTPSAMLPHIIDTHFSNDKRALCSDTVTIALNVWKMDGTLLYSSTQQKTPLTFTLGASEVPLGLEEAVTGIAKDSQRIVIMPPGYSKPLDPHATPLAALKDFHWPDKEIVLVEITILSVVEKSADSSEK
jgi:FKBP-type peptidyl-prolyl cis-trans isomerase 2